MSSCKITLNTGIRLNLFKALKGDQSGVGIVVSQIARGLHPNVDRLEIQSDPSNGANLVAVGDGSIGTDGTGGVELLAGDRDIHESHPPISLANKFISVDTSPTIINVLWE